MSNPIDRTLALLDDLVVIARCVEAVEATIETVGDQTGMFDESELIRARRATEGAWADVQDTRNRLNAMGVRP